MSEWKAYRIGLKEAGVLRQPGLWYDLRGNHDCFDVPGWDSNNNFYQEYGVSSKRDQSVFGFEIDKEFGRYKFVGIDAW